MLVLSRKIGEKIQIGEHVCVTVVRIGPGGVRLGIEAPAGYSIARSELNEAIQSPNEPVAETPQR